MTKKNKLETKEEEFKGEKKVSRHLQTRARRAFIKNALLNAEQQQSRGYWAPLIMHHKCASVLHRSQALSQVRTPWKQRFRAFMSARGTEDGRSSASQLLLHLLGLPVENESLLMAGSRCQRRTFLSFHHRSCHIASTWSPSDPPYMNLQLCPSGWIQRWCTEAWLILRYSTFYEQEKKKNNGLMRRRPHERAPHVRKQFPVPGGGWLNMIIGE